MDNKVIINALIKFIFDLTELWWFCVLWYYILIPVCNEIALKQDREGN